jgi:tRNA (guanine-N(7)-)-methyltransferase subunit TRM82
MSVLSRAPYQCLLNAENFLVAARGSSIDLCSLEDLSLLSTWKCPTVQASSAKDTHQSTTQESPDLTNTETLQASPPAKRRKVAEDKTAQEADDGTQRENKKPNYRSDSVVSGLEAPAVTTLAVTRTGQHVIAVTGEDKSIRVFEIAVDEDKKHYLKILSQRWVKTVFWKMSVFGS